MDNLVGFERRGCIGIITIDSPPVNALGHAVRLGLVAALEEAERDPQVEAIVLNSAGRIFTAGADIREFGKPSQAPTLPEVVAAFDRSPKPIVAALHGTAFGGGLELPMGCHYRVALAGTRIGLPEVKLGLLPGAGGTQRLPRLTGAEQALDMILTGNPVEAEEALELGIVDAVYPGGAALDAALDFIEKTGIEKLTATPVSSRTDRIANTDPAVFAAARAKLAKEKPNLFSPQRCVDAVEAAVQLPFTEGLVRERALFQDCMASPQRAGLIHAFFGEREVAKIPSLPAGTPLRNVEKVGVIGAGTMGSGIAMCFASAGIPVTLVDAKPEALQAGLANVRRTYEGNAHKGRISAEEAERRIALVQPADSVGALTDADLVIEAVFEDMELKKKIFAALDKVCKQGAILATNTSTLDVDAIAEATSRPQDVCGMHFFSPANIMRLLENVRGAKTSDDVIATIMDVARRIGKVGVLVGVCYGFVGNRMLHQRGREAMALVEEGAAPEQVDAVLKNFGFPMGHFAMSDLAGVDVGWRIRQERRKAGAPDAIAPNWLDRIAELGRYGQKTGAGIYRYEQGDRTPRPDPEVAKILEEYRREAGIVPRMIDDQEILERCLYSMINEGARILEEGVAQRAVDIDVIWLHGYGFPAYRGGPMFWADQVGLGKIHDTLVALHEKTGEPHWKPSALLERLARTGQTFASL
ncbi:3-hydroxyacyl-CoA dehydrogenase NAD-binding domain-containing protein [Aquamicrobium defluvii]|uniref:3-hydroxyacyl-CoA dehydrogenase n=1 Tax=Aquamicrobium defluvii TaxID=69279 RepID=A0A011UXD8_9HYPH|nr:3-hydroxyacyl-CoA dehydrogenase NAD-binding domain-containing protein [Aquamicrobium defluvii]EXL10528.1 3-hydroxyacyl-CoA dehydrogenase [Aquamicrobium defluvii]EZQ17705.1 3-hydroxyacyl-CoA dehydrogenase [Halopseudomonas bauzanensis]TDR37330.1 3-hydroxyacyl-CoA dehydrogenase [Aquamicrobium defluvii]